MNACTIPFDISIGNTISQTITTMLTTIFNPFVIKILDKNKYIDMYGYEPDVSSCFVVSIGGSYYTSINNFNVNIHNGTLVSIVGHPEVNNFMNSYIELVFGGV